MKALTLFIVLHYTLCAFKLPTPAMIAFLILIWIAVWGIVGRNK